MKPLHFFFLIIFLLHLRCFYSFSQTDFTDTLHGKSTDMIVKGTAVHIPGFPVENISSKNLFDQIEISVKDNGSGIPESIKDKIFQPFFTPKPTGQGTGLGFSLSYNIVKAHSGKISINSKEDEGTEFTVLLPL